MNERGQIPANLRTVTAAAWTALAVMSFVVFVAGVGPRFRELTAPCAPSPCPDTYILPASAIVDLEAAGVPLAAYAGYTVGLDLLAATVMLGLAAVIFRRRSGQWIGLVTSTTMLVGMAGVIEGDAALVRASPGWLIPTAFLSFLAFVLVGFLLSMFPSGQFFPRAAPIGVALFTLWAIGILLTDPSAYLTYEQLMPLVLPSAVYIGAGLVAQVVRYARVSTPLERQQTKWVLFGFFIGSLSLPAPWLLSNLSSQAGGERFLFAIAGNTILYLSGLAGPLALALGILRYRLWDIDLVIRRTLGYGLLTGSLALIYFATVVLLQRMLPVQSGISVVLTTLLIAALFNPLRRRIQETIDTRFYRKKYDASRILREFSTTAREEVDIEILSENLMRQVGRAMQPAFLSLWLSGRALQMRIGTIEQEAG